MNAPIMPEKTERLKRFIKDANRIVVFTGAGISTESGISDFRSKGGLWDRFQPVTIQEFLADEEKRKQYWQYKNEVYSQIRNAQPNQGHLAIADLEKQGKLAGVITQNIDGLHQMAGCTKVLEIHGTNREVICLTCLKILPAEEVYQRLADGEEIPLCSDCGGFLKPNTISFGQALNPDVHGAAIRLAKNCDLMLAIGSTLVVEPAASLPRLAKEYGAKLVIIGRDQTPLDRMADLVINTDIGPFLDSLLLT